MGWGLKEAKAKTIVVTPVLLILYRLLNKIRLNLYRMKSKEFYLVETKVLSLSIKLNPLKNHKTQTADSQVQNDSPIIWVIQICVEPYL